MDNGIPLPSSDSTITSKENKNISATFKIQMKIHCLSLKSKDDALFKSRSKTSAFFTKSIKCHVQKCSGQIIAPAN